MLAGDFRNAFNPLDVNDDGEIAPLDVLLLINHLNQFGAGPTDAAGVRPGTFVDPSGDDQVSPIDALLVINHLNNVTGSRLIALRESRSSLAREAERVLSLPDSSSDAGRPVLTFDLRTRLDSTSNSAASDVLNVLLFDPSDPTKPVLDLGALSVGSSNAPLLAVDESRAEFNPSIVTVRREQVEIDLSSLGEINSIGVRIQLLSLDGDDGSRIVVENLATQTRLEPPVGFAIAATDTPPLAPGVALDEASFVAADQVVVNANNAVFDSRAGRLMVEIRATNRGPSLGRDLIAVIEGLPAGVSVVNASGMTAAGSPFINLEPAAPRGGLRANATTAPIRVEFDVTDAPAVDFDLRIRRGTLNSAPTLASLGILTMHPGEVRTIQLAASDADGDPLAYSLTPLAGQPPLPTMSLNQAGELTLRPMPDQLGSFQFELRVSDGAVSTSEVVRLDVVADPNITTRISGVVRSTDDVPLEGVPIEIAGFSDVTDAEGAFTIELPTLQVPTESLDIPIPMGEPLFDPFSTGTQVIRFRRARHDVTTGESTQNPRQNPNLVTSFLDASVVYGSDAARAVALRTLVDGKLKSSANGLLPLNDADTFPGGALENDNEGRVDPATLFAAGDVRANENIALIALHTILVREHNRLADEIKSANPTFDDEQIYQHARRLVGALLQQITYGEYLPMLLGSNAIPAYTGYDPDVDPRESSLFAVAAFRIGHTQTFDQFLRLNDQGQSLEGGPLALRDAFFTAEPIKADGIEPYLLGLAASQAEQVDARIIDDLRNFLFGPPGAGGIDLASLNIQRGRDMGLPSYNQARADFGLPRVIDFAEISSDVSVQLALRTTFGSVNNIDVWSGGISEDHVPGSLVGPLFQKIIADQFQRTRDGDRFWFENGQFTASEQAFIRGTTLASLIERNTTLSGLPTNLFTTDAPPDSPESAGSSADAFPGEFRSIDGAGNNLDDSQLGSTRSNLLHNFTVSYGDGISTPAGAGRPNPREISNGVHAQSQSVPNSAGATGFMVFWGQLLSHDLGLTPGGVSDTLRILGNQRPNDGGDSFPFVAERMDLLLGHSVLPGSDNVIARPIFLPALDSGTTIDADQSTVVRAASIANATITVAAGSLTDRTGQMFTGDLSITEVPPDRTPAALPANLFPDLVVTIQPADLVFTTPAPLTLPNRSNLPVGTLVDLYSINPITGEFEIVGTGQVASSGQQIETIAGGIRNSSWHFAAQQISEKQLEKKNDPAKNPLNQDEGCDRCEELAKKLKEEPIVPSDDGNATKLQRRGETTTESTGTSEVETHSGALRESHFLVSYQSLGEERGLSLHYNSLRADPRPIFHFDAVNVSEGDVLVASLTVSRGGLELQVPGFAGGQFGLQGGEHFWDLPEGVNDVDAAIQVDLRDQPTGVYDFNVAFGPRRFNGQIFAGTASTFTTPMTIINSINSPFGAGWDLAGLQQVIENPDGSVMLIGGEGTELMFKPQGAGQPFDSPAGDFSTFEELSDGSYRRTFTDQTVVLFDDGGRIASVTDRNGNQTTYNYDSDGFITTIVDPVGLTTTFTRTGDRITKITDPATRDTILEYDAEGNLTRITDPDGTSRQFHYDAEHHLVGETNKRGFSEEAEYGFHGRVVSVLRKDGSRSQFESAQTVGLLPADITIDPLDRPMIRISNQQAVARFADPLGNVTTSILDQAGQVKSSTDAEGNLPSVVRNQDNLPVVSVDGRGNATFRKFDQRGNVTEIALEQHERSPGLFDSEAFLTDARSTFVRMADFDNDGDLDVIVAHDRQRQSDQFGARFLTLFENDGAGRLTKAANVGAGVNAPETFVVGDVNNDGFLDIAFVSQLNAPNGSPNDNFRVLLGNGDLTFQQTAIIALGRDPSGIDLGDINGDGNLDAIVSHETNTNLTTLLLGDGTGAFTAQTFLPGDVTRDVKLGDINGDGNLDAVFAGQNSVRLMLGNGAGGFAPNVRLNDVNQSHDAIALVDINSNGRLDILAAGLGGVAVFENVGAGDFVESTVAIPNAIIEDIATADLNFDGHIDFVVPDRRVDTAFVFLNDGLGRFTRVEGSLPMGESPRSVATGDLDGDGFLDLANANQSFANYIGVTFGKGDGRFLSNIATTGPTNTNSARGSELGDVNGDGVLDLVTLLDTPGINVIDRVAVQLGDGVGGFGLEQQFEAFNDDVLFRDLAIGDLNNDGLGDVVVATGLGQRISVLLSEGNGRLAGPLLLTTATNEDIVHIADLDSDGNNDIVVAGSNDLDLSVLFGDGQGAFTETVLNVPANGVNTRDAVTIADVDSDGDLDIVFAANVFRIFQNDGGRSFTLQSVATSIAGATINGVRAVDVNGDDLLDLIGLSSSPTVFGENGAGVITRLADGSGGFLNGLVSFIGKAPVSGFDAADFDLDGNMDVVVSSNQTHLVSIAFGDGTGVFNNPKHFTVGAAPQGLALGDIDHDGDLDIATASFDRRNTTLLLNHAVFPCETGNCTQRIEYDPDFSQVTKTVDELGRQQFFEIDPANGNMLRATVVFGQPDAASGETDDITSQFTYTSQGLIDTATDPLGRVTDFDYDAQGRLVTKTFAVGSADEAVMQFEYDLAGNLTVEVDENNHRTEFEYDALNRVVLIRDALGGEIKFEYDEDGNVTRTIDELDQETRFEYDTMNRLIRQTDDVGGSSVFEYDTFGNLTRQTDRLGRTTEFKYDLRSRVVEIIDPEGGVRRREYDEDNNVLISVDENGNAKRSAYNQLRLRTHLFDALHGLTRAHFDAASNPVRMVDRLGRTTEYEYDDANRMVATHLPDPDRDGPVQRPTMEFTYDKASNQTAVTDPLGNSTLSVFDNRDRLIERIDSDPDGAGPLSAPRTQFTYDNRFLITSVTDPLGDVTRFEYDELDRLVHRIDPDPDGAGPDATPVFTTTYDAFGNIVAETDALANTTTFAYDSLNRLVQITDPDPDGAGTLASPVSKIEYDAAGQVVSMTDPLNRITRFEYDKLGRLTATILPDPDAAGPDGLPVMRREYDPFGNQTATIDALGNRTELEYDGLHRLIRRIEADPDGNGPLTSPITTFEYDAESQLVSTADPLNRRTSFVYDDLGRLVTLIGQDPDGPGPENSPITHLSFDIIGNLLAQTDAAGSVKQFEYDNLYRRVRIIEADPDGAGPLTSPTREFEYDVDSNLVTAIDPLGRVTSFEYDALDRLVRQTDPDPDGAGPSGLPVTTFTYDLVGNVLASVDSLGNQTTFDYDNLYRPIRRTDPDPDGAGPLASPITRLTYDVASQLTAISDPLQRTSFFEFDDLGRIIRRFDPDPDGTGPLASPTTTIQYDLFGNNIATTDAEGSVTRQEFDALNRVTRVIQQDPDGDGPLLSPVSSLVYDAAGQLVASTDPLGRTTRFEYDGLGRLVLRTQPDPDNEGPLTSPLTRSTYDLVGNLLSSQDALGHTNSFAYDALHRRIEVRDPNNDVTRFEYDSVGNLVALVDPLQNRTTFEFDGLDRIVREANELGDSRQFDFDTEGNLLRSIDRNGRVIERQYDNLYRKVGETWLDGANRVRQFDFTYDAAGQMTQASDPAATYDFIYDDLGRLTEATHNLASLTPNVTMQYSYNAVDKLLQTENSIGGIADYVNEYAYDGLHRNTQILQRGAGGNAVAEKRIDMRYDVASQMEATERFADLVGAQLVAATRYTYDLASRLTELAHAKGGTDLAGYTWSLDAGNRVTQATSLLDGVSNYAHDDRNQLLSADYDFQANEAFTYDENGNRIGGGHVVGTNNHLLSDGTFNYEYDAEGNRTRRIDITTGAVTEYEWDHRNRLIAVTERASETGAATQVVRHTYDFRNRWIGASVDTDGDGPAAATDRIFVYEDNQIVLDFAGSEAEDLAHRYLWGRQVDQFFTDERVTSLGQSGEILWGLTDNLGTVRDLATYDAATDTTTIANHRVYDVFGNLTSETNSAIDTLFEFTGRPFDDATGLQNNLNRWLDSTVGRWLSEDPIGFAADDANLNRYVSNMPLTGTDPDGLIFFFTFDPKAQINISRGAANTIIRHAVESFDFAADLVAKSLLDLASWAAKDPVLKEEFRKIGLRQFGKDIIDSLSDPGKLIALMEAAFQKRVADYHKLIDAGCNDEAQELIGQTAVEFAEFAGALNALRKLAKNAAKKVTNLAKGKPKPNVSDRTPKISGNSPERKTKVPDGDAPELEILELDDSPSATLRDPPKDVDDLKVIDLESDGTPSQKLRTPKVSLQTNIPKVDPLKPQRFQNTDFYNGERVKYHYTNAPIDDFKNGLRANTSVTNDPFLGKDATKLGIDPPDKVLIVRDRNNFDAISNGGVGEGTRGISSAGDFTSTSSIPERDILGFFEIER